MIWYVLIMIVMLGIFATIGIRELMSNRTYSLRPKIVHELSWPARQLVKEYNSLPPENRPHYDIVQVVRALDVKHVKSNVNNHHRGDYYDNVDFKWACCGYRGHPLRCRTHDYHVIYNAIKDIKSALAEQEYQLQVAGVQGGLDAASDMLERLKEESNLINQVTKELT